MSVNIEFYFNCNSSFDSLANLLAETLGLHVASKAGDSIHGICFGMDWSLQTDHGMLNAPPNLDFEDYEFVFDLITPVGAGRMRPIQLPLMLCIVHCLQCEGVTSGMLTYDSQRALARYVEGRQKTIINELGDTFDIKSELSRISLPLA